MARGTGGIDRQVTALADAYRNNPAALQQNYPINKDLMALLALEKLRKEKEQKEAEIAMAQTPASQTIAQQRADEAIGRSQKEVAEQVGNIAQLQNRKGQQNLQRMAAGAPPANPQMAGIASQPAPNMARMAKGGIVSFAEGSEEPVGAGGTSSIEELLREAGFQGGAEKFRTLPMGDQQRILDTLNARRTQRRGAAPTQTFSPSPADLIPATGKLLGDAARGIGLLGPEERIPFIEQLSSDMPLGESTRLRDVPGNDPVSMSGLFGPAPAAVNPTVDGPPADADPSAEFGPDQSTWGKPPPKENIRRVDYGDIGATTPSTIRSTEPAAAVTARADHRGEMKDFIGTANLADRAGADWQEVGTTARNAADAHLNREGIAQLYRDKLTREEAFQKSQEAARRPHLDLLAGARGAGAFADAGRAAAGLRREAAIGRERDFRGLESIRQDQLDTDLNVAKESLTQEREMAKISQADIANATSEHRAIMNDIADSLSEEATLGLQRDEINMNADQIAARLLFDRALAKLNTSAKIAVAEYAGRVTQQGNAIQKLALESNDRETLMKAVQSADTAIAALQEGIQKTVNDQLAANLDYTVMEEPDKTNYRKKITAEISQAFEAMIVSQQVQKGIFKRKLQGSFASGNVPVSGFGDSKPKQTRSIKG